MDRVKIGLIGFGTVGSAFYRLMEDNGALLAAKTGCAAEIALVAEKDAAKARGAATADRLVTDWRRVVEDPQLPIVVELVGGTGVAHDILASALAGGKHVITANKALLALRGRELFSLARQKGVELRFEAAVCGGIPIIKVVREGLVGNRIGSIMGIVNGTSNYILTQMSQRKLSFQEALRDARARGFAEADPTLDVGGGDSAHKISLLASLAFGVWVDYRRILCEGIEGVSPGEIEFAESAGFTVKLIAAAVLRGGRPSVTVFPALIPREHPLASVHDEVNGVFLECDFLGPALFLGRGAGGRATASALASDLGDLLPGLRGGGRQLGRPFEPAAAELHPSEEIEYRFFFHFITENRPGIWAAVTTRLAENGINIESVHQKWEDRSRPSDLYVLVDEAREAQASKALQEIRSAPGIFEESRFYRILP
jgi:homoserine dehydrogenase